MQQPTLLSAFWLSAIFLAIPCGAVADERPAGLECKPTWSSVCTSEGCKEALNPQDSRIWKYRFGPKVFDARRCIKLEGRSGCVDIEISTPWHPRPTSDDQTSSIAFIGTLGAMHPADHNVTKYGDGWKFRIVQTSYSDSLEIVGGVCVIEQ